MPGRFLGILLVASLSAAACGKAVDSSADPDAGDGGDDDDGTENDAAPEPDAPPPRQGIVRAFNRDYLDPAGAPVQSAIVEARFGDRVTDDCEIEMTDLECSVLTCRATPPDAEPPDAGTIVMEIVPASGAPTMVELPPQTDGTYMPFELTGAPLYVDGQRLVVTAAGDDVPGFSGQFQAPIRIRFDAVDSVPTSATPIAISAADGYALRWAPGGASDQLRLTMSTAPDDDNVRRVVDCRTFAGTGSLSVSSALLSSMPVGPLAFEALVETRFAADAGDFAIDVSAVGVALNSVDTWAQGMVDLMP
jgi:hypothetical protein